MLTDCNFTEIESNRLRWRVNISGKFSSVRRNVRVYGSVSGNYAFRGDSTIWYESTLERDFIKKLEFNDSVIEVVSQPVVIPYETELGNQSSYTPDFLIQFITPEDSEVSDYLKPILAEVKPRDFLVRDWKRLKVKFRAAHKFALSQGWQFKIYDEGRIRDQFLENINFINRFLRSSFPEDNIATLISTLRKLGHCPINMLPVHIYKSEQNVLMGISLAWHLVARKVFSCDMTQPLNQATVIWVNEANLEHNKVGMYADE